MTQTVAARIILTCHATVQKMEGPQLWVKASFPLDVREI